MQALRSRIALGLAALALLAGGSAAHGFGTWDTPVIPGYAEHERITRMGIQCSGYFATTPNSPLAQAGGDCAQDRTTLMIAGGSSYLGGVGAPDSAFDAVVWSKSPQHCDDGDHFDSAGYPRPVAERTKALMACRRLFTLYMDDAVKWAGRMVPEKDGVAVLDVPQTVLTETCNEDYDLRYWPGAAHKTGWAKCNALISFGRAMHMAEDFSSHSNWVDTAWPQSVAPTGLLNPPALGRPVGTPADLPEIVRYPRSDAQVEAFLAANPVITGGYTGNLSGRITHSDRLLTPLPGGRTLLQRGLNKDMGSGRINWKTGVIPKGKESRGLLAGPDGRDNFQRAAYSAAATAATGWADLEAAVKAAYPGARGELAWRAMTHDTPWSTCAFSGAAGKALAPSQTKADRTRTVNVTVVNRTGQSLDCGQAVLDWGEWSPIPPDRIEAGGTASFRTQSARGGAAGTEGRVTFTGAGDARVTISWDNPVLGSNRYSCPGAGGLTCSISGGRGNDSAITVTIGGTPGKSSLVVASGKSGTTAQGEALRREERAKLAPPPVDEPMTRDAVQAIPREVAGLRACSGKASRIALKTDDVSCRWVLGALRRLSEDLCPPGWSYRPVPEGEPVLCALRSSTGTGDARTKAFQYVQPHFDDGHALK